VSEETSESNILWAGAVLGHFFGMAENTNTTEASLSYTTEQQQLSTSSPQK